MPLQLLTDIRATPLRGGAVTVREKALLPFGAFSDIQNLRGRHPGFEKRKGIAKQHSTANSTTRPLSLYQFSKGRRTERHFFAQWSDDDVWDATTAPPGTTSGAFGTPVFTGTATSIPASWGNINDLLLFSNGTDQHQIYAGTENYVTKFIKYDASAAPPNVPTDGYDYSKEVTDGLTSTSATLNSLNVYAQNECLFIMTPVPATRLYWTMGLLNTTGAVGTLSYRKNDNTWFDTSEVDGTIETSGKTLGKSGSMTWTQPSDEIPCYMFGMSGYWYRWETGTQLDSTVTVTGLTYGHSGTAAFVALENVWDGQLPYAIEARFFDNSKSSYYLHATSTIQIDDMVFSADDSEDRVYFNSVDNIMGIYVDVGETPNLTTNTVIAGVKAWTGAGFTTVGTITDGTNGFANSGWITWARLTTAEPSQFQTSRYYSHWYYLYVSTASVSDDVVISIETMPFFDIAELGISRTNCVWGDRAVYSFDRYGQYVYITARDNPLALNGSDYGIIEVGDGRTNEVTCMKKFHNELMVWQEELGKEGGCLTLIEGYSPTTFGKLVLSTRVGTFNAKSAVVVDGVLTSTATEEKIKTLAFFLSHYGICASDGKTVTIISDDIQNYFDPTDTTNCIRRGYEKEMWLEYDSAYNVLRIGLVTGGTATTPNTFLVFDLIDKTWSFDAIGQNLSCMTEVEAASGDIPVLQYGGGTDDGAVYRLNTGTDDVDIVDATTAIDAYVVMEFGGFGEYITLRELLMRVKAQSSGDLNLTITQNAIAAVTDKTLSMTVELATQIIRRHRLPLNITDQLISVKLQNAVAGKSLYLLDVGLSVILWKNR